MRLAGGVTKAGDKDPHAVKACHHGPLMHGYICQTAAQICRRFPLQVPGRKNAKPRRHLQLRSANKSRFNAKSHKMSPCINSALGLSAVNHVCVCLLQGALHSHRTPGMGVPSTGVGMSAELQQRLELNVLA